MNCELCNIQPKTEVLVSFDGFCNRCNSPLETQKVTAFYEGFLSDPVKGYPAHLFDANNPVECPGCGALITQFSCDCKDNGTLWNLKGDVEEEIERINKLLWDAENG